MENKSRGKNIQWNALTDDGKSASLDNAQLAVLMDLRDELQKLNALLHCQNFMDVPRKLDRISRNTAKPRKPKGGQ